MHTQLDCPPLKINAAPAPLRQLIEDFENDLHRIGDFTYAYFSSPKTRTVKPVILSNYPDSPAEIVYCLQLSPYRSHHQTCPA